MWKPSPITLYVFRICLGRLISFLAPLTLPTLQITGEEKPVKGLRKDFLIWVNHGTTGIKIGLAATVRLAWLLFCCLSFLMASESSNTVWLQALLILYHGILVCSSHSCSR